MRRNCVTQAKPESGERLVEELTSFVIVADTPNPRMRSYGPPSLLNIHNHKLIDLQIKEISKYFGNYEILLCTGFESEKITRYIKSKHGDKNIRTVENQNYTETNSCETLRLALNNTNNNNIFILDGNLLFDGKVFLNTNCKNNKSYTLFEQNNSTLEVGININENGYAEYIGFGAMNFWAEILYLNETSIINSFSKHLANVSSKRKFIFEIINNLISSRVNLVAVENYTAVYKIQGVKYYHRIKGEKT